MPADAGLCTAEAYAVLAAVAPGEPDLGDDGRDWLIFANVPDVLLRVSPIAAATQA
ncbi:MAG: hypothetical protein P8Y21_09995 [Gemmatimonadales bacterium]|jgi:hypothetical protein